MVDSGVGRNGLVCLGRGNVEIHSIWVQEIVKQPVKPLRRPFFCGKTGSIVGSLYIQIIISSKFPIIMFNI
jgi:hypothetical protein